MEGTTSELIKEISASMKKAGASVLLLSEDIFDRIFKSNYYSESELFRVAVEITGDRLNFIYDEFGEEVFFRDLDKKTLGYDNRRAMIILVFCVCYIGERNC